MAVGLFALISCFTGCAGPSIPVEISLIPQSKIVFSTQTDLFIASDSLGNADLIWSATGPNADSQSAIIGSSGTFIAPEVTQNTTFTVTVASRMDPAKSISANVTVLAPSQVTTTTNPQVALYTLTPPSGTTAFIQFGTDMSYGLMTWSQPPPTAGGPLSFFVAGMLASTLYHMRAVVVASDGTQIFDVDHTFTTQAVPNTEIPALTVITTPGATPQPGIELLDLFPLPGAPPSVTPLTAIDLSGNLLWSYPVSLSGSSADGLQGAHLLPNGHFLVAFDLNSSSPLNPTALPPGTINVLREIDLGGNTIREESLDALNASLLSAGYNITAATFHHDVIALPNGHWIALTNTIQPCTGRPECATNPNILGDVLVDLAPQPDGTFLPVWVWNSFDYLDVTRAPLGVADWTHSNAILYSPDDGNLLVSMRHQSWIIKIDYDNGQGNGNIIWRLGYQGDFALLGGTDPTDWFYAQHGPSFSSPNTTGKFLLAIMDNGNDRVFPPGVTCGAAGSPACLYSSAIQLLIDEASKTATIVSHYLPDEYSFWGGNAEQLTNGNIEADFNSGAPGNLSDIFEVSPGIAPNVVWHLRTSATNAYRGFRLPSLYPGVQW
jgi:arylsulfate sulfotransferase